MAALLKNKTKPRGGKIGLKLVSEFPGLNHIPCWVLVYKTWLERSHSLSLSLSLSLSSFNFLLSRVRKACVCTAIWTSRETVDE